MEDILLIAIFIVILLVLIQGGYIAGLLLNVAWILALVLVIVFLYRLLIATAKTPGSP